MSGRLAVIGLGPGDDAYLTAEARTEIAGAEMFYGYAPYLARLALRGDQTAHASDNRAELSRAEAALTAAAAGARVAVVSGGDPGVFAMAAAVCEAIDHGPAAWREVEIAVVPGITAMLAAAARVGAPLGHDFCALSLSDNLKPWDLVCRRLRAAADTGMVVALYNPASRARPWQLVEALRTLATSLAPDTPVIFARAVGRPDETVTITTLAAAPDEPADMATCVIVGGPLTQRIERPGRRPLVYSARAVPEARQ